MSQVAKSQIDPLNRKNYGAISAALTVTDVEKAYEFCQKAFGFEGRGVMRGPGGKPMHAELKLRDSVLMLGPEWPDKQGYSAKSLGNTPTTLYLYVEDVDRLATQAVNAGDRLTKTVDPDNFTATVALDADNRMTKTVDEAGNTFTTAFDADSRETSAVIGAGSYIGHDVVIEEL